MEHSKTLLAFTQPLLSFLLLSDIDMGTDHPHYPAADLTGNYFTPPKYPHPASIFSPETEFNPELLCFPFNMCIKSIFHHNNIIRMQTVPPVFVIHGEFTGNVSSHCIIPVAEKSFPCFNVKVPQSIMGRFKCIFQPFFVFPQFFLSFNQFTILCFKFLTGSFKLFYCSLQFFIDCFKLCTFSLYFILELLPFRNITNISYDIFVFFIFQIFHTYFNGVLPSAFCPVPGLRHS